jgi:hypothetical protein
MLKQFYGTQVESKLHRNYVRKFRNNLKISEDIAGAPYFCKITETKIEHNHTWKTENKDNSTLKKTKHCSCWIYLSFSDLSNVIKFYIGTAYGYSTTSLCLHCCLINLEKMHMVLIQVICLSNIYFFLAPDAAQKMFLLSFFVCTNGLRRPVIVLCMGPPVHWFIRYHCVSSYRTKLKHNETWRNLAKQCDMNLKHKIDGTNMHGTSRARKKKSIIMV